VRAAIAVWLLAGTMLLAAGGWRLTGSAPLDAGRAQLAVHRAGAGGRVIRAIGPGIARWSPEHAPLQIAGEQARVGVQASPVAFRLTGVPAGAYRIRLSSAGSVSGDLTVTIGQSAVPWVRYALQSSSPQDLPLVLPVGVAELVIDAPDAVRARVHLEPVSPARPGGELASRFTRFPGVTVFFLDSHVFPEAEGLWVKGGATASMIMTGGPAAAGRTRELHLRNGGAANTVTVRSGSWQDVVTLTPGQVHTITLPAADATGAWPVIVTSASGFRPSATAGSTDTRYLGVWVQ
jgi:hypothetical protein